MFDKSDNINSLCSDTSPVVFQMFDLMKEKQPHRLYRSMARFYDRLKKQATCDNPTFTKMLEIAHTFHMQEVQSIVEKSPPVPSGGMCILYRGINDKYAYNNVNYYHSKLLSFIKPRSFTLDKEKAIEYATTENNTNHNVLLVFHLTSGTRALPLFLLG